MPSCASPIVVLDSGLGGLTVARALRDRLPGQDIIYFGDTARLPYGSKSAATVTSFVQQIIAYLRDHDPKHIVIACNTATALALPAIRASFCDLSISGVIDPGAKAAAAAAGNRVVPIIGVLATEATIRSRAYERAIHRRRHHARLLLQPAPLLAPIVEEGRASSDPLVKLAVSQYLQPMLQHRIDVLVLGCTHYPILRPAIAEVVGERVKVIDSAEQCAQDVAQRLAARGLVQSIGPVAQRTGRLQTFVTDDPARFRRLAERFLGFRIDLPTLVCPEELYRTSSSRPASINIPA